MGATMASRTRATNITMALVSCRDSKGAVGILDFPTTPRHSDDRKQVSDRLYRKFPGISKLTWLGEKQLLVELTRFYSDIEVAADLMRAMAKTMRHQVRELVERSCLDCLDKAQKTSDLGKSALDSLDPQERDRRRTRLFHPEQTADALSRAHRMGFDAANGAMDEVFGLLDQVLSGLKPPHAAAADDPLPSMFGSRGGW